MDSTEKKVESENVKMKKDMTLMDKVRASASKQSQKVEEPSTSQEKQTHESMDGRIGLQ
jgi:hypothetical protein